MSSTNDATSLTSRVIALIVAVVIVAVVMMPIINSLTDTGNSGGSDSGGDAEVLYTNTGTWYYDKFSNDAQITYSFQSDGDARAPRSNLVKINDGEWQETGDIVWTDEDSWELHSTFPVFTFKTSDGKYGIEGLVAMPVSAIEGDPGALMTSMCWYRAIQGDNEPVTICMMGFYSGWSAIASVSLSNGTVTYNFPSGKSFQPIDGEYELYLTGETSGDYTWVTNGSATVIADTQFYVSGNFGKVDIEVDDPYNKILFSHNVLLNGKGTVSTLLNQSNISVYGATGTIGGAQPLGYLEEINPTLSTSPAESGEGLVLGDYTVSEEDDWDTPIRSFIVPTEITAGGDDGDDSGSGSGSGTNSGITGTLIGIIPIFVILGILVSMVIPIVTSRNRFD